MRVALLTMLDEIAGGVPTRRAFLRVGGASVARHQLALALALGCERIVCIAAGFAPEMTELHHAAEAAGARIQIIAGAHGLIGLVAAQDEVIALADGLFAWPERALPALAAPGVVVQPVERGLAAGFERLDLNHAAAGALRLPGRLVEPLADLPVDCDAVSALYRIAIQAGAPQQLLPDAWAGTPGGASEYTPGWSLIRTEAEAHAAEAAWVRMRTDDPTQSGAAGPTMLAVRGAVRALGPALLHAGSGGTVMAVAAGVLLLLALAAGWFGLDATALVLVAVAAGGFNAAVLLRRVEMDASSPLQARWFGWLIDGALVLLLAWRGAAQTRADLLACVFAPLALVGLARLVAERIIPPWRGWLEDRAALALVLAVFGLLGPLLSGVRLIALALLAVGLWPRRAAGAGVASRLTPP